MDAYYQRLNSHRPIVSVYDAEYEGAEGFFANAKNIKVMT